MHLNFRFPKVPLLRPESSPFASQKWHFWKAYSNLLINKGLQVGPKKICNCINIQNERWSVMCGMEQRMPIFVLLFLRHEKLPIFVGSL